MTDEQNRSRQTEVRRSVDVDSSPEDVWELLTDDDERDTWFGGPSRLDPVPGGVGTFTDPDGSDREARVDVAEPGRRLAWTWWPADDESAASRVDVVLVPSESGTTVTVTERPLQPISRRADGGRFPMLGLEIETVLRSRAPAIVA